ncbi:competence type IV pilus minor pilin ComGG [Metabacillus malikii]|uniref:Competence protein ComG n=1 Tax=Metabacillus malikii TaxID=1504265 RepID=A0ABT9ZI68_9BACI|nr:competence type IV pilus minor pilin ComGG [Metabacillus malikii]MDQ0231962.1 hypothetical protein [Metabacillus malikii]
MSRQAGFILPSTIIVIFLCLLIFGAVGTTYVTEKNFLTETEQYYILDNMKTIAIVESLKILDDNNIDNNKYVAEQVNNGEYSFKFIKKTPNIYEVQLHCKTSKGREYTASYQYNLEQNKMIGWSE